MPSGAGAASAGVKATWTRMGHRYANREVPTCYRHPDRETGLSCSECGRPICTDCVTFAPVGLRCPDHAASGTAPKVQRQMQRVARGSGLGFLSTDAIVTKILVVAQRRHLPDHGRPGRRPEQPRRQRSSTSGRSTGRPSTTATGGG